MREFDGKPLLEAGVLKILNAMKLRETSDGTNLREEKLQVVSILPAVYKRHYKQRSGGD